MNVLDDAIAEHERLLTLLVQADKAYTLAISDESDRALEPVVHWLWDNDVCGVRSSFQPKKPPQGSVPYTQCYQDAESCFRGFTWILRRAHPHLVPFDDMGFRNLTTIAESDGVSVQASTWDSLTPEGKADQTYRVIEDRLKILKAIQQVPETEMKPPAAHGPDFRSVNWYGQKYTFTGSQAAVVKILWHSWEKGCPDIGLATLLEAADAAFTTTRLKDVFKGHPALGLMIQATPKRKGLYRLVVPEEA